MTSDITVEGTEGEKKDTYQLSYSWTGLIKNAQSSHPGCELLTPHVRPLLSKRILTRVSPAGLFGVLSLDKLMRVIQNT